MKKRYFFIIPLVVVLLGASLYIEKGEKLYHYFTPVDMASRSFSLEQKARSNYGINPLNLCFDGRNIVFGGNENDCPDDLNVHAIKNDGTVESVPLKDFKTSDDYTGTFLVYADNVDVDLDGDGRPEKKASVSSKTGTREVQGFFEYDTLYSSKMNVPVEVVHTYQTSLQVYKDGEPYSGTIHFIDRKGRDSLMTLTDGVIPYVDIRDLWNGITVLLEDGESGKTYIASYQAEENTLLTHDFFRAWIPLQALFSIALVLILTVMAVRHAVSRHQVKAVKLY